MIIGVVGTGGGVGVSTMSLLLAVALREQNPATEVVLVEADRAGGVAGARFDLGLDGGVGAWVSGLAADPNADVSGFGKLGIEGFRIIPGPVAGVDAEKVLSGQAVAMLAAAMGGDSSRSWVLDLGRGGSEVSALASVTDVVLVVSSGLAEHVVRLPSLVSWARPAGCVALLAGRSSWSAAEVKDHCGSDAVVEAPSIDQSSGEVVDLIEGRRRGRSKIWRATLESRDRLIEVSERAVTTARSVS